MNAGPRVLLMQLSERTSGRGNRYLSGWLGKASVVAFAGEPDRHGNPTWDVFVSEPQPRSDQRPLPLEREAPPAGGNGRAADPGRAPANTTARPQGRDVDVGVRDVDVIGVPDHRVCHPERQAPRSAGRGDGWRGSQYRRPANGAARAPAADGGAFYEDDLTDIGR
jgi:hypothetical protein